MTKVYFVVYCCICSYTSYLLNSHHYIIAFLVFFSGIPAGMLWLYRHNRDKDLKKQGLKVPSFYDDFKKDFSPLIVAFKKTINALKISFIWASKAIFKGLKWLFKPAHIRLFFFLIKEGIVLFFAFVLTVIVFVSMFTFSL